jgi:small subunit ribosomal protein S18
MAEHKGGRPISNSQRPTGGDKALMSGKRQFFRRRKVCKFCVDKVDLIDYKDVRLLSSFISERGKIVPRRISGVCTPCQRRLSDAIKQARNIALLPFAGSGFGPERRERPPRQDRGDRYPPRAPMGDAPVAAPPAATEGAAPEAAAEVTAATPATEAPQA